MMARFKVAGMEQEKMAGLRPMRVSAADLLTSCTGVEPEKLPGLDTGQRDEVRDFQEAYQFMLGQYPYRALSWWPPKQREGLQVKRGAITWVVPKAPKGHPFYLFTTADGTVYLVGR